VTGVRASARSTLTARRSVARVRARPVGKPPSEPPDTDTLRLLKHWRDAVPDDRFAHLVKDATRTLVRALQRRLARFGVPFGHWAFLRILWESDGLTQRELSREAGVMEPTTSGALKAMQSRGYIARRRLAGNRRKIHIFLTRKGRALQNKLVPLAEEVNRIAVRGVAARDVAATRRTLLAVLESLARDEAGAAADPPNEARVRQARRTQHARGKARRAMA
jgi:MarR family transcriptional regulator, organic hydroperoxide resistance regulator